MLHYSLVTLNQVNTICLCFISRYEGKLFPSVGNVSNTSKKNKAKVLRNG